VNECSLGLSGQVVHEVNRGSKALGGKVTFLWSTAKSIVRYTDRKVRVSMDGGPFEEMAVTSLIVANGRFFGGGMCVAPTADAFDGVFDVTLWSGYGLVDLVRYQGRMFDGTHVSLHGTRTFRCTELRAEAVDGRAVLLDCDGEQPGRLPCRIQMLRGAIDLVC
jgi:diacylglycerol kinase family enzyme